MKKKYIFNRRGTIFNNPYACLKKCQEIIQKLQKNNLKEFNDEDFGPNKKDKYASSSFYIVTKPPGYPETKDN